MILGGCAGVLFTATALTVEKIISSWLKLIGLDHLLREDFELVFSYVRLICLLPKDDCYGITIKMR